MADSLSSTSSSSDTDSDTHDGENRTCLRNKIIQKYFFKSYKYQEIIDILSQKHAINLSLRQLKRILINLNLKRRNKPESSLEDIFAAVLNVLDGGGGCCLGYKSMWLRLKSQYKLNVKRGTVLEILRIVDPEGIKSRSIHRLRRRVYSVPGPNFIWHLDGYEKLKPFKFPIHGCIDGYSKKIIWLRVASSNNDPNVVAYHYLNIVKKLGFIPRVIRSDCGTENVTIEVLQKALRYDHDDKLAGIKSYIKGKSTSNQRIESYWSQMRRSGVDYWISLFKDMRDLFIFNDADPMHVQCIRYCFGPLIEHEFRIIRREWNNHLIRRQKNVISPSGRPNHIFYCSSKYNVRDFKKKIDPDVIESLIKENTSRPVLVDPYFNELVQLLIPGVKPPTSVKEALKLYKLILKKIDSIN
ncbi:hypothetical protein HCN44_003385 [Aphidius gifuensis]|uniref:Integrase core domain-containing protein n=1 Tax=Aphidius gifuensis TaxID=684658 RepID=A0A835CVE8_APHGI|nr:hypothetical protein HCN44_003385 [Aphidius gifuensis]